MAQGTYTFQVDWNGDSDFGDTGEDVTSRTLRVEFVRGRDTASQLTGRSASGRLVAVLNNESGDYSSFNTASPLTGNIVPGRKVRLLGGSGSFPYTFPIVFDDNVVWTGFLERLIPEPSPGGPNLARLEAVGPLGYLNQRRVSMAMAATIATGAAVDDVLDAAGWPAADRSIDTGQTTMTRFWTDRVETVTALRKVEDTENGFIVETRAGKLAFEDRHHRLAGTHLTSQATFSDAAGAARRYSGIRQEDPLPSIFNVFEVTVQRYTVGGLAVLWTLSESGANSPALLAGESKTWWASYPNPDSATDGIAVDAWTTPVASTDYTVNTQSGGGGSDLSASVAVAVEKFAQTMKITLTNNSASDGYVTLLQARGTPVTADDPVTMMAEDATSQTSYGERTYPAPGEFVPDTDEGQDWATYNLGIYKDPIPLLAITLAANRDNTHLAEALTRDISDRITVVAENDAGLGINEDFFIEAEHHVIDMAGARHQVTWDVSPASGYAGTWVLGISELGISARWAY